MAGILARLGLPTLSGAPKILKSTLNSAIEILRVAVREVFEVLVPLHLVSWVRAEDVPKDSVCLGTAPIYFRDQPSSLSSACNDELSINLAKFLELRYYQVLVYASPGFTASSR